MLGLPAGKVIIADYSPAWPAEFQAERARVLAALGGAVRAIEHIGSTAVPGLAAKPVIDIALAVDDLAAVPALVAPLAALGYEFLGEYGLPGRLFFRKGEPATHHIHAVRSDSEHWRVWRLFRDYLRRHAEEARRYAEFKRELAGRFAADRDAYTRAKTEYVSSILIRAGAEATGYKPPSTRLESGDSG